MAPPPPDKPTITRGVSRCVPRQVCAAKPLRATEPPSTSTSHQPPESGCVFNSRRPPSEPMRMSRSSEYTICTSPMARDLWHVIHVWTCPELDR